MRPAPLTNKSCFNILLYHIPISFSILLFKYIVIFSSYFTKYKAYFTHFSRCARIIRWR